MPPVRVGLLGATDQRVAVLMPDLVAGGLGPGTAVQDVRGTGTALASHGLRRQRQPRSSKPFFADPCEGGRGFQGEEAICLLTLRRAASLPCANDAFRIHVHSPYR